MTTQYDNIADQYQKAAQDIEYRYVLDYSLQQRIGEVAGKSVLDLACGSGDYTRPFVTRGASKVVGVDNSEEMLNLARKAEAENPLGIKYILSDVQTMEKLEPFDIVTASFLLNYAQSETDLIEMGQVVYDHLKPGQRFITLNGYMMLSFDHYYQVEQYKKYGVYISLPSNTLEEGAIIRWTLLLGQHQIEFDTHYLAPQIYESALKAVGFKTVIWHPIILPTEVNRPEHQAYWQYLLEHPLHVVIECQK
ncbi:class I SAM-dependent methyltransferase [Anaerolineales bacterium HSG24]|nr:class I SAM-dependent methyltransferase [Anaerolineales bacterium HSG24]